MGAKIISNVNVCEGYVRQAQAALESAKDLKKQRQANGTYKKENKMYRGADGVVRNYTDDQIYQAQQNLKRRKEELAQAKKDAKKK